MGRHHSRSRSRSPRRHRSRHGEDSKDRHRGDDKDRHERRSEKHSSKRREERDSHRSSRRSGSGDDSPPRKERHGERHADRAERPPRDDGKGRRRRSSEPREDVPLPPPPAQNGGGREWDRGKLPPPPDEGGKRRNRFEDAPDAAQPNTALPPPPPLQPQDAGDQPQEENRSMSNNHAGKAGGAGSGLQGAPAAETHSRLFGGSAPFAPVNERKRPMREQEKEAEPDFGLSGALAAESNKVNGVVLLHNEPAEAANPTQRWRLYQFKGGKPFQEPLPIHRQSCYLFGRERRVADVPTDHPSCSKQHAVLQFRRTEKEGADGLMQSAVRPYMMDMGSVNGTHLNNERIEAERYYELLEQDMIRFGNSTREYVLLHESSNQ